ncbi:MAG: hypothetical protein MI700_05160 [Balneolales bacterium]|nr:hypothetical protein [Balneolales bacterium]
MKTIKLKKLLLRHIERIDRKIAEKKKLEGQFSMLRLIYFIVALITLYLLSRLSISFLFIVALTGFILGFFVLVDRHNKVSRSLNSFKFLRKIKEDHIARIDLNWEKIDFRAINYEVIDHPFANDLDILGKHSLSQLVDTSIYSASSKLLMDWLLSPTPQKEEILRRQEQVKELIPLTIFRDKLRVIGLLTTTRESVDSWSIDEMLTWLRLPKKKNIKLPLFVLSILSVLNIAFFILLMIGKLNALPLTISFVSYLLIFKFNGHKIKGVFDAAFQIEQILARFELLLFHVERFRPKKGTELEKLLANYQNEERKPSLYIRKAQKLMAGASMQANELWQAVVNALVPWDYYYAMRLEELKGELEPKLTIWMETFYEIEALNSLANFAMLNPEYAVPTFEREGRNFFSSFGLGHPLIPENHRVTNDFKVEKGKDLFLVTGSNMAGKSTFLRTVGINLILAYAGAPVCAKSLNTDLFRVFTSINVVDSLDDGYSHFYAEVRRLKYLLDELSEQNEFPLFFMVDEIYRGTNNKERLIGSSAFLNEVAGKNGIGLVSSHDLELASLERDIGQLVNIHFVESIKEGKMHFEYKLKDGPCPSTNAVQIMKMEGLPT